jgi:hypothetical protein
VGPIKERFPLTHLRISTYRCCLPGPGTLPQPLFLWREVSSQYADVSERLNAVALIALPPPPLCVPFPRLRFLHVKSEWAVDLQLLQTWDSGAALFAPLPSSFRFIATDFPLQMLSVDCLRKPALFNPITVILGRIHQFNTSFVLLGALFFQ